MSALIQTLVAVALLALVWTLGLLVARVVTRRAAARRLISWGLLQGYVVLGLWRLGGLGQPSPGLLALTLLALAASAALGLLGRTRSPSLILGTAAGYLLPWALAWITALRSPLRL